MKEVSKIFVAACSRTMLLKVKNSVSKSKFWARELSILSVLTEIKVLVSNRISSIERSKSLFC